MTWAAAAAALALCRVERPAARFARLSSPCMRPPLAFSTLVLTSVALSLPLLAPSCADSVEATPGKFFHGEGPDGVELNLDRPAARVLPANLHAAELVAALVPLERMVGVPATAFEFGAGFGEPEDWGADRILGRYRGEDVLALRPDLVISGAYQDLETTALLRREGVAVLGLPTVRRIDDVEEGLLLLGELLDAKPRAEALLAEMSSRRAKLSARTAGWTGREALVYTNYGTGAWTQGIESPAEVLLGLAGLVNAAGHGQLVGHYQIDIEHLIALDPDVIICGSEVAELGASARVLMENPVLRNLTAVQEGRVVTLPADLFQTSSHRLLDAAELLVESLEDLGF